MSRTTPAGPSALITLDADQIDAEACVTTVGQNRPREQQNIVFLLVPEIVHVKGEVWSEDRVMRTQEVRNRLEEVARDVRARRKLKAQPENYGITADRLAEKDFDNRLKERELALETVVTQVYNAIWFPSASGQVISKEIKAAGGEGGASVLEQFRHLLQDEGELITTQKATTQETLLSLGKLFFESSQTPTLEELRRHFACNRRWPILEQSVLLEQLVRAGGWGVSGVCFVWEAPRASGRRPFSAAIAVTCRLSLTLAPRAGPWLHSKGRTSAAGPGRCRLSRLLSQRWVVGVMAGAGATSVTELVQQVTAQHGEVPESAILGALEKLRQADRLMTYRGQPEQSGKPADLIHGTGAILHAVQGGDVVIVPAEAAKRGWVRVETPQFKLTGHTSAQKLIALFPRLGSLYARGARSTIKALDLWDSEVQGGGRLRLTLEGVPPEAMKRLGELFEVLATVVKQDGAADVELEVDNPDDQCGSCTRALQQGGKP